MLTLARSAGRFNLSQILDKELTAGPVKLNLANIKWPDSIQETLDDINQAILGVFVIYAIGAGFSGLAFLSSILALWKPDLRRVVLANFVISSLGFLSLLIGSIVVTVAANKGVKDLNKAGEKVGLSATTGTKFYTLSWISTSFMGIVALFWLGQFCAVRRDRKRRGLNEKHVKHIDS